MADWQLLRRVAQSPQRRRNRYGAATFPVTSPGNKPNAFVTDTQATAVVRGCFQRRLKGLAAKANWGLTSDRHAGARVGNGPGVCFWGKAHAPVCAADPLKRTAGAKRPVRRRLCRPALLVSFWFFGSPANVALLDFPTPTPTPPLKGRSFFGDRFFLAPPLQGRGWGGAEPRRDQPPPEATAPPDLRTTCSPSPRRSADPPVGRRPARCSPTASQAPHNNSGRTRSAPSRIR